MFQSSEGYSRVINSSLNLSKKNQKSKQKNNSFSNLNISQITEEDYLFEEDKKKFESLQQESFYKEGMKKFDIQGSSQNIRTLSIGFFNPHSIDLKKEKFEKWYKAQQEIKEQQELEQQLQLQRKDSSSSSSSILITKIQSPKIKKQRILTYLNKESQQIKHISQNFSSISLQKKSTNLIDKKQFEENDLNKKITDQSLNRSKTLNFQETLQLQEDNITASQIKNNDIIQQSILSPKTIGTISKIHSQRRISGIEELQSEQEDEQYQMQKLQLKSQYEQGQQPEQISIQQKQENLKQRILEKFGKPLTQILMAHVISHRLREFKIRLPKKSNLFEGLPFIAFNKSSLCDANMQFSILRDSLKILNDKVQQVRNYLQDQTKLIKIFSLLNETDQLEFNQKLESTIAGLFKISQNLLQDFASNPQKIGINYDNVKIIKEPKWFFNEFEAVVSNILVFKNISEYLKDSFNCYQILFRRNQGKGFKEAKTHLILKLITQCRFNLGEIYEKLRIYLVKLSKAQQMPEVKQKKKENRNPKQKKTKNIKEQTLNNQLSLEEQQKQFLLKTAEEMRRKEQEKQKKQRNFFHIFDDDNEKKHQKTNFPCRIELLNKLLKEKFSRQNKQDLQTRESKINLNQNKLELESRLLTMGDSFLGKSQIGDSRNQFFVERVQNPFKVQEIKDAFQIAKYKTQINIPEDISEIYLY